MAASTSQTVRVSPPSGVQLLVPSRPVTTTRSPVVRDAKQWSARPRQALTVNHMVSRSVHAPEASRRLGVLAMRKSVTAMPLGVVRLRGGAPT